MDRRERLQGEMKQERRSKIIELIGRYQIETQEELAERLEQAGYSVTQATVSRDIRELKLTKIPVGDGARQKYTLLLDQEVDLIQKYVRVLQDGLISMEPAGNILVIKTISGMAMAVAAAVDNLDLPGVVGTIAGDDTVMCAIHSVGEVPEVCQKINLLVHTDTV